MEEEVFSEISEPQQAGFITRRDVEPEDVEGAIDFKKGTIEYPRKGIASWFDQMKTVTPQDLGYTSMESFIEGEFEKQKKENPDFISSQFNNDREVWRKWFAGPRTVDTLPVPVPQKGKEIIGKGGEKKRSGDESWRRWSTVYPYKNAGDTAKTIDPIDGKKTTGEVLKRKINKNKVQFANLGIIIKEEWPFWDRVSKEKARQSLRK